MFRSLNPTSYNLDQQLGSLIAVGKVCFSEVMIYERVFDPLLNGPARKGQKWNVWKPSGNGSGAKGSV